MATIKIVKRDASGSGYLESLSTEKLEALLKKATPGQVPSAEAIKVELTKRKNTKKSDSKDELLSKLTQKHPHLPIHSMIKNATKLKLSPKEVALLKDVNEMDPAHGQSTLTQMKDYE